VASIRLRAVENSDHRHSDRAFPELVPPWVRQTAASARTAALSKLAGGEEPMRSIAPAISSTQGWTFLDQFVVGRRFAESAALELRTNMNANECRNSRRMESWDTGRGEYQFLHPIDDVNMAQSTNDAIRRPVRLA